MGLLEDAIREHLELKRRHGAGAEEVARAERDALGPSGRPTPLEDTAAAHAAETTPSAREASEPAAEPFDLGEDELEESAAVLHDGPVEPAAVLDDERIEADADAPTHVYGAEHLEEQPEHLEEEPEEEPEHLVEEELPPIPPEAAPDAPTPIAAAPDLEAEPPPAEPPLTEPAAGAGVASTLEDAQPDEPPDGDEAPPGGDEGEETGEDVLEETPEFLQETPEHDRLWFEQKPPRDFDFGS
ncbi:MAG: hypothetical protein ACR2ML_03945 [Solirubrobacteraceae bacterium]